MDKIIDLICKEHDFILNLNDDFINNTVKRRMDEIELVEIIEYYQFLENNSVEKELLVSLLHVSWSSFFREPLSFCILEKDILPKIIENKKKGEEIRVWSVGCAAGQEPYSIAIILNELIEKSQKEIGVRIFATDISEKVLEKARKGVFRKDEVGNVRLEYIDKYFESHKDKFSVKVKLKEQIDFSNHDVLDKYTSNPPNSIFGGFDIIFCRNLLIYYNNEIQIYIINKLIDAVRKDGYLVTGEAEKTSVEKFSNYTRCITETAVLKCGNKGLEFGGLKK